VGDLAWTGKPNSHTDLTVDPTNPGQKGTSYLERSPAPSRSDETILRASGGEGREKSAEVIVARPGEGPNL
jgi:hypothetical protein